MNEEEFRRRWWDRASRYPDNNALPTDLPVHLFIDPGYAGTYPGQVAAITAAGLFGRMTTTVAFDTPPMPVVEPLPWIGVRLDDLIMKTLEATHRWGRYEQRAARKEDLRLVIGPSGSGLVVHGSGWAAYHGPEPSPLPESEEPNPYGAAFAVVAAAAQVQRHHSAPIQSRVVDTYRWQSGTPGTETPSVSPGFDLGELWSVGVGSVGSCSLFFLSLITRAFRAVLIDADTFEVENITRSAILSWRDAVLEKPKVEVATRWLRDAGVEQIEPHALWLDQLTPRWDERQPGAPDILISAANERNVRQEIENGYPPLQVYATTGRNWQTTLFRHIPMVDPCSTCVPGVKTSELPMPCATGSPMLETAQDQDDIALPFLSYAAGLMTAAEITKLALNGDAGTPNRVFFEPDRGLLPIGLKEDPTCPCRHRSPAQYQELIRGSLFAPLSGLEP